MRDDILSALEARQESVEFAGKQVTVRELDCVADLPSADNGLEFSLRLIVACVVDAQGAPVFTDEDLPRLRKSARKRIKPLIDAVMRVNGFSLESETKNSGAAPASG